VPCNSAPPVLNWPPWRRTLFLALLLNSGVALVLRLLGPTPGGFWLIWVRSHCIGVAIRLLALDLEWVPGIKGFTGVGAVLLLVLPAALLGYFAGMGVSGWLPDLPATLGGSRTFAVTERYLVFMLSPFVFYAERFRAGEIVFMLGRADVRRSLPLLDLVGGHIERYHCGAGIMAEEHVFVPRPGGAEGAGWLLGSAVYAVRRRTLFSIFDAEHLAFGPLVQGETPRMLPAGLHGTFVLKRRFGTTERGRRRLAARYGVVGLSSVGV
jgi:hypothetical protein